MAVESFQFTDFLDASYQELVLGLATRDGDFLGRARAIIQPNYFVGAVYQALCRGLFAFWDKYHSLPSPETFTNIAYQAANDPETQARYAEIAHKLYELKDDD